MGGQDCAREAGHGIPVVGETHVASVARDESAASRVLEFAHVLAHSGLAQSELDPRVREAASLGDSEKSLEKDRIKHKASLQNPMTDIGSI
jgi:hypothetical protein